MSRFFCVSNVATSTGALRFSARVPRRDAHVPAARAPFRQFVIRQRAGGHGVNGLAAISSLVGPELEDESFAGAGRRVNDDVLGIAQGGDGLLLPKVGNGDLVEGGKFCEL